ncbi:Leukemia inhibitory factor receptor [Merluccius polli]|uniref:Leukemia inhibitory factor receptor n=1 Tax=Merluccius polli TaxID=89951 RepID=A0AA47NZ54_MERPO|nr:Leukemia inhibitory factor receptor [Merluccius polli]
MLMGCEVDDVVAGGLRSDWFAVRCGSLGGLCEASVRRLLPNTRYSARVRCGLEGKTRGRWTHAVAFNTAYGVAQHAPQLSALPAEGFNTNQTIVVRWLSDQSRSPEEEEGRYEVQVNRTDIVHSVNVSVPPGPVGGDGVHAWEWTSPLPLECADHSVRIRRFCDDSVSSSWSQWETHYGLPSDPVNPRIFPSQRVTLAGTGRMFCCTPPPGAYITGMTIEQKSYDLISIGDRVKAINVTADRLTIPRQDFKRLLFTFPPDKPRNLSCETSDLKHIACRWDPGKEDYLWKKNKRKQTLYIDLLTPGGQDSIKCDKSSCGFPAVPGLEEYHISLLVSNPLGQQSARYSFNISDRVFPEVKLHSVRPGLTEVNVSWTIEEFLSPLDLLCEVQLDSEGPAVVVRCGSLGGHCEASVRRLLPNTRYSARVRCGLEGKTRGRWTHAVAFNTEPLADPDLWRRISQFSNNIRNVTLIWTLHMPGSAGRDFLLGYEIQMSQEGEKRTMWADKGQSQAEVSIGPGQCEVTVQAAFHNRSSKPAYIAIPPVGAGEQTVAEKRVSFSEFLSWTGDDSATCGYTVEWCILGKVPCALQWMKMPRGNASLLLNRRDYKDGYRYTFNIYGCTESGHKLLEIQTGYFQELRESCHGPVKAAASGRTCDQHFLRGDAGVALRRRGSRSPGVHHRLPGDRAGGLFNVTVPDPKTKRVTVPGLQEGCKYRLSLSALTKEGSGPDITTTVDTSQGHTHSRLVYMVMIPLLLGCAIILVTRGKREYSNSKH